MHEDSKTTIFLTTTAEETEALGAVIGRSLRGGETISLASDLGGGKTTFVRGLARGAGSRDHVSSPTFTISKLYRTEVGNDKEAARGDKEDNKENSELEIHHFDFYRLQEAGIMRDELAELVGDPSVVIVVEWSDIVKEVLPEERLTVKFNITGDSERCITLIYPTSLAYLLADIESKGEKLIDELGKTKLEGGV